jgi:hypothetical protein
MNDNWFLIIAFIAVISVVSVKIYKWCKMPNKEQMRQVQEWLLYAVAKAEENLGCGTGELKLRYVYDMFVTKFPAIAIFVNFDDFCIMVEEALTKFKELLANNTSISAMYDFKNTKGEEENE